MGYQEKFRISLFCKQQGNIMSPKTTLGNDMVIIGVQNDNAFEDLKRNHTTRKITSEIRYDKRLSDDEF